MHFIRHKLFSNYSLLFIDLRKNLSLIIRLSRQFVFQKIEAISSKKAKFLTIYFHSQKQYNKLIK